MMTLFGTTLGAAWPWFLIAIPASLALLIYIFRAKGLSQPKVASTLFLLRKLPSYLPRRRKFIPPLQFWLELLACILLAGAASGLFTSETGSRIAVILDTSMSMATQQTSGETRLEAAKRIASADVSQSAPTTRFALFTANSSLTALATGEVSDEKQSSPTASARSARSLIANAPQSYSPDRLQSLVASLTSTREFDQVWVYTDKAADDAAVSGTVKIISIPSDPRAASNVWIESLSLKQPQTSSQNSEIPQQSDAPYIHVSLSAVGPAPFAADLLAECSADESDSRFALPSVSVTVKPGSASSTRLGPIRQPWSYCRISVKAGNATTLDLLTLDNEAWVAKVVEERSIALHSSLSPDALGLTQIPYAVTTAQPDSRSQSEPYSIYHRQLPKKLPLQSAAMFVFPPAGSTLWGGGAVAARATTVSTNAGVTRWSDSHPLMQYLQPNLITIPTAVVLTCPDTAKPVLFTAEGPLVCAGEESGARYIITGFELFPFDGLRSPTVSIFTLNALRWLFQSGAAQSGEGALGAEANSIALDSSALVGTIALPNEVQSAAYVAPDTTTLANRPTRSLLVTKPGIVQLNHAGTDASAQTLLAVNALFHEESDISLTPTIALPEGETPPQASANTSAIATREKTHLEAILTLLLLIALTLDLIRRIVTRSRWGGLA